MKRILLLLSFCLVAANAMAQAALKYAGKLAFSPTGTLFVGDNVAGAVWAFETGAGAAPAAARPFGVSNIDARVAEALGVPTSSITLNGMAVHPTTREVYLSVSRSYEQGLLPAILKVGPDGQLANVDWRALKSSQFKLSKMPDGSRQFRSRAKDWPVPAAGEYDAKAQIPMNTLAIMDLVYHQGELFVSGISNEEFASTLRRIPYPFGSRESVSSIRMYHIVHSRYETRAPIRAMRIATIDGQETLVAAYTCSPLVLIPLNQLKDGAKVSGRTIGDMGNGQPTNMVAFKLNNEDMLFVTNLARGPQVIPLKGLSGAKAYSPENVPPGQLYDLSPQFPMGPVGKEIMFVGAPLYTDLYNDQFFVSVIREAKSGQLNLQTVPTFLPITLDEVWSEYDFKGGEAAAK